MLPVTDSWQPVWSHRQPTACGSLCWACLYEEPDCTPRLAFTTTRTRVGTANVQNTQSSALVKLNHFDNPWLCSLTTQFNPKQGGAEWFLWARLLLPLSLMPHGKECSAWERWFLQYGEWISTRILAAVSLVLSPEPPAPNYSYLFQSTLPSHCWSPG